MRENCKIIFLVITILFSLTKMFSVDENKKANEQKIIILVNVDESLPQEVKILANYLIDSNEALFLNNKNIKLIEVTEIFENNSILNYFALGINALVVINAKKIDDSCRIDFSCYSSPSSVIYDNNLSFIIKDKITNDEITQLLSITKDKFVGIDEKLFEKRQKAAFITPKAKKMERDFPLFNISASAISLNMYMDARTSTKIFAFSPIDIKLTFYPIKHLEVGTFITFDIDNTVYKYYDKRDGTYGYFNSSFNFLYGFHIGGTFFYDKYIYSLGLRFYNTLYTLTNTKYEKPNSINGYFVPSFDFYQKLDIKIFKFIYYTLFMNIKLLPLFELDENNYFYSTPFNYDFVMISISLVGITISL